MFLCEYCQQKKVTISTQGWCSRCKTRGVILQEKNHKKICTKSFLLFQIFFGIKMELKKVHWCFDAIIFFKKNGANHFQIKTWVILVFSIFFCSNIISYKLLSSIEMNTEIVTVCHVWFKRTCSFTKKQKKDTRKLIYRLFILVLIIKKISKVIIFIVKIRITVKRMCYLLLLFKIVLEIKKLEFFLLYLFSCNENNENYWYRILQNIPIRLIILSPFRFVFI